MNNSSKDSIVRKPEIKRLFEVFDSKASIYIVGGAVRDVLLGRTIEDIDFSTDVPPQVVIDILREAGINYVETGIEHGTVTAIISKHPFQITSFRHDINPRGRHADVTFGANIEADANRRDFTINALYINAKGEVIDPTGLGIQDIKDKRIRFIGDAGDRIKEDYLRILRFFRFNTLFLPITFDSVGLEACHENALGIKQLSRERVTTELMKILSFADSHLILENMMPELAMIFPKYQIQKVGVLEAIARSHNVKVAPIAKLVVITDYIESSKILLSNKEIKTFKVLANSLTSPMGERALNQMLYEWGMEVSLQTLLISAAHDNLDLDLRQAVAYTRNWIKTDFPLTGQHVMDVGIKAGPKIGRILKQTTEWWIDNNFKPDKTECLNYAKEIIEDERDRKL